LISPGVWSLLLSKFSTRQEGESNSKAKIAALLCDCDYRPARAIKLAFYGAFSALPRANLARKNVKIAQVQLSLTLQVRASAILNTPQPTSQ